MAHAHRRQQGRGRLGNEPELYERRRERCLGGGDDVIAMQQHGHADPDGKPADRGDQRFLAAGQRLEKTMAARVEAALGRIEKIADVVAGAEHPGRPGEQDAADGVVAVGFV